MKRKICAITLVFPLIFTISCSQKKQENIAGVESTVSEIGVIKSVQYKPDVVNNTNITQTNTAIISKGIPNEKDSTVTVYPATLSAAEQQMVTLVNQARLKNHVPALKVDMQLTKVARIKAQDMISNKYFSHISPKYGSPFDMMKSFGIKYRTAGENIAGNSNIKAAETSLMNSPGHRKNILNPGYTYIGIGIKSGGPYGNMISQMFISK